LKSALVFGVSWILSQTAATKLFAAWQAWAPNAPSNITSIMKVQSVGSSMIKLRCIGQSVGSESELRAQLGPMLKMDKPSSALSIQSLSFLKAVQHFASPLDYESVYMKAKSDYGGGIAGQHRGAALRRLWRQDRRYRRDGYRFSPPRRHAILHPVLLELDQSVRYGLACRKRRESLRSDAAFHA
jgi:hypothetical protein